MAASEQKEHSGSETANPPRDTHGIKWLLVVLALISATFLWGLDGTIVADIQATFVEQFNSINKLAWNSVAFFLGAAATVLSWGQAYSHLNAKWIFCISVTMFEIGSAVCGAAPSQDVLIAGRAICGVGGAGMYLGVLTLLSLMTTEKERPLYMGYPGLTWGAGTVLGPVIGGAFAISKATWRWGFYINLCVGAVCAPIYLLLIPSKDPRPGVPLADRLLSIDWLGLLLLSGTTTALLMGLCFGATVYKWNSPQIIALLSVGGVLCILFFMQQTLGWGTGQAVFPVKVLRKSRVAIVFLNEACASTACFLPCYFIPLYFQFVVGDSPLMAGVRLLPFIISMVGTVMLCGAVVSATGKWLLWFFYGGVLVLVGGVLMFTVDEHTSAAKVYGFSVLIGSGSGAYIQMPFNVAQQITHPNLIPAVVGLITYAQLAAPAFTLSIANAVFLNRAKSALSKILPPGAPTLSVISGFGSNYLKSTDPKIRRQALHAIVQSMAKVYILIFLAGVLTLILTSILAYSGASKDDEGSEA